MARLWRDGSRQEAARRSAPALAAAPIGARSGASLFADPNAVKHLRNAEIRQVPPKISSWIRHQAACESAEETLDGNLHETDWESDENEKM